MSNFHRVSFACPKHLQLRTAASRYGLGVASVVLATWILHHSSNRSSVSPSCSLTVPGGSIRKPSICTKVQLAADLLPLYSSDRYENLIWNVAPRRGFQPGRVEPLRISRTVTMEVPRIAVIDDDESVRESV